MKRNCFTAAFLFACLIQIPVHCTRDGYGIRWSKYTYRNSNIHQPVQIDEPVLIRGTGARNMILFIGDGMGVAHVYAGLTANRGKLNLEYLKYIGFLKTQSFSHYVTDSGAGGTAMATGVKTYNEAIGVDSDTLKVPNIIELAESRGLSTGLITTCEVTHATPASFFTHRKSRHLYESIARDYLDADIEVVIGGGLKHFTKRKDKQSLIPRLEEKGYRVITDEAQLEQTDGLKLFALLDEEDIPKGGNNHNFLPRATKAAIDRLSQNHSGFFLMIEGQRTDWGGHDNCIQDIVDEMLALDRAIGVALEFAQNDGETLIICTADHETGGLALEWGDILTGTVRADFTTGDHTGVMVPVFSIGPGADQLIGIYENTALFEKMKMMLGL